jgi:hypothetical protein
MPSSTTLLPLRWLALESGTKSPSSQASCRATSPSQHTLEPRAWRVAGALKVEPAGHFVQVRQAWGAVSCLHSHGLAQEGLALAQQLRTRFRVIQLMTELVPGYAQGLPAALRSSAMCRDSSTWTLLSNVGRNSSTGTWTCRRARRGALEPLPMKSLTMSQP